MARTPVRITDLSTDTAQVVNTTPSTDAYGLVVRTVGGAGGGSTTVRVTNTTGQRVPVTAVGTVGLSTGTLDALEAVTIQNSTGARIPVRVTQDTSPWVVSSTAMSDIYRRDQIARDIFGANIAQGRYNQVEVDFISGVPSDMTTSASGGGSATAHEGHVHFNTSSGANGKYTATSSVVVAYKPGFEVYAYFTAAFVTAPGGAGEAARIGLFNDVDGYFIGYEAATFGLVHRRNSVDTVVAKTAWDDPLTGGASSRFRRNGSPEAINLAVTNIFRIRFGWLGSAPIVFEVLSPDGEWVVFHTIRRPNTDAEVSVTTPNLPMRIQVTKTGGGATDIQINSACLAAGVSSSLANISATLTDNTLAALSRSVIVAKTPSGSYTNIQANSQGRLQVTNDSVVAEDSTHASGTSGAFVLGVRNDSATVRTSADGDYSPVSVDSAGRIGVSDLGGSVTVDGTVSVSGVATEATLAHTKNKFQPGVRTTVAVALSTAGNNTIVTPTTGKRIRLHWIGMVRGVSVLTSTDPLAVVKFGSTGTEKYRWYVGAFSHWEPVDGPLNTPLIVNLSAAAPVQVNVTYEEAT